MALRERVSHKSKSTPLTYPSATCFLYLSDIFAPHIVGRAVACCRRKQTITATKDGRFVNRPYGKKPKPHGVAVCSHNTPVGTGVLDGPKRNEHRNENGGRGNPSPTTKKSKASRRGGMLAQPPSLPLWGARLQATVEFCKQNIECRGTRRMRCSTFSRYKIWTPHPPLSWSPFSRWRRLAKKAKTSRRGGLFAQHNL